VKPSVASRPRQPPDARQNQYGHPRRQGIFAGLDSPLTCTRYHSLIVAEESFPAELMVTASTPESGDGPQNKSVIMGLRHRTLPIEGVQFHPRAF